MLLKSSQLTDYGDPSAAVLMVPPRAAVEFIQTVTILDFSYSPVGTALAPSIINVDVPTWANFKRYKKIQFSFGSFAPSGTGTMNLRTRRNFFTYDNTKYFTTFAPTGTASLTYSNTSASTTINMTTSSAVTPTSYIRQLDIFLSQMGGDTECLLGARQGTHVISNINRTNFSFINPERTSFPGYLEADIPGVQLFFDGSGTTFRPPDFGNASVQLNNYKLDCNIYGWLR